jgi:hypothetical protein
VVCERDPELAVTVTVYVVGFSVAVLEELDSVPQPAIAARQTSSDTDNRADGMCRRRLQPNQANARARVPVDVPVHSEGRPRLTAEDVVVDMVSEVCAGPPLGVTVAGTKAHESEEGRPEHVNATGWLKPLTGVTVTPSVTAWTPVSETVAGDASTVKSGAGTSIT